MLQIVLSAKLASFQDFLESLSKKKFSLQDILIGEDFSDVPVPYRDSFILVSWDVYKQYSIVDRAGEKHIVRAVVTQEEFNSWNGDRDHQIELITQQDFEDEYLQCSEAEAV